MLANDSNPQGKPLNIINVTQPLHGKVTYVYDGFLRMLRYTPNPRFVGEDQFTYGITTNGVPNLSGAIVRVTVVGGPSGSEFAKMLLTTGSGYGGPEFRRFGIPSINDQGDFAFSAAFSDKLNATGKVVSGLFLHRVALTELTWIARKGQRVPDASGNIPLPQAERFRSFKEPLLNSRGDVAFVAQLSDARPQRDSGIWLKPAEGRMRMIIREGDPADGVEGARFGKFISIALSDLSAIPFVAKLQVGKAGVTTANALGLWMVTDEGTRLLLRQSDTISVRGVPKRVKLFAALTSPSNSPGHGRLGTGEEVLVRVTWSDKIQSLIRVSPSAAPQILASTGDVAPGTEAQFASFGIPSADQKGGFALSGTLQQGVTETNDVCVYEYRPEAGWALLAREGAGELLDLERSQPVRNAEGRTAFLVINRATGAEQVWTAEGGQVYGESSPPAEQAGRSIVSLAFPGGEHGGVVYLAHTAASAAGKKPAEAALGLWAIDDTGVHHLLCRVGQSIITAHGKTKTIRALHALRMVPGSPVQPRSLNSHAQILYRATFNDGTQAIFQQQLP